MRERLVKGERRIGSAEVDGYVIEKLISEQEIKVIVQRLADEIYSDFFGKNPLLVGILKGANMFHGDLVRELGRGNLEIGRKPMPMEVDFLQVVSYQGEQSTGEIRQQLMLSTEIYDRDVILVEDILDTGRTLSWIVGKLRQQNPASLSVCVLLDKPEKREVPMEAHYCGRKIPNRFVVGNGLDWNQKFRWLPYVGVVVGPAEK